MGKADVGKWFAKNMTKSDTRGMTKYGVCVAAGQKKCIIAGGLESRTRAVSTKIKQSDFYDIAMRI